MLLGLAAASAKDQSDRHDREDESGQWHEQRQDDGDDRHEGDAEGEYAARCVGVALGGLGLVAAGALELALLAALEPLADALEQSA